MKRSFLRAIGTTAAFGIVMATGFVVSAQHGRADDGDKNGDNSEESKIRIGFAIAPVRLNLKGKNRELAGLGSYIVNAQADCNGCHTSNPATEFAAGGNPYFGQHPTKVNPDTYLGGGRDFGALPTEGFAHIISRNLTPGKNGIPMVDHTFPMFLTIMRTGEDMDLRHPNCTGAPGPNCIPAPFDGMLLQIMPWPTYHNMTDHDLRAIYEYLSTIPCIEGDPGNPTDPDTHGHRCS
jgi:hypothetical protein